MKVSPEKRSEMGRTNSCRWILTLSSEKDPPPKHIKKEQLDRDKSTIQSSFFPRLTLLSYYGNKPHKWWHQQELTRLTKVKIISLFYFIFFSGFEIFLSYFMNKKSWFFFQTEEVDFGVYSFMRWGCSLLISLVVVVVLILLLMLFEKLQLSLLLFTRLRSWAWLRQRVPPVF